MLEIGDEVSARVSDRSHARTTVAFGGRFAVSQFRLLGLRNRKAAAVRPCAIDAARSAAPQALSPALFPAYREREDGR
jgi:hypothetical protein